MSTPINAIVTGTFTTDAAASPVIINLPCAADEIEITNLTDIVTATNTPAVVVQARGLSAMRSGTALAKSGTGAGLTIPESMILSNGFTFFTDTAGQNLSAATALTAISQAATAVVATGDTTTVPLVAGDVVRLYTTTGMLQVASMDFSVGTVVANTSFQLKYLNSAGFGAAATSGTWRKIPFAGGPSVNVGGVAPNPRFYPRSRYVTAITAANPAVVTLSVAHSFTVGEKVRLIVPAAFGMVQMNNQLATITAVNLAANTITLDIDSSSFTAFAFPTSAIAAAGITFAQVVPVGEAAVNTVALPVGGSLADSAQNVSKSGVYVGSGVLVASKNYSWIAKKGIATTP